VFPYAELFRKSSIVCRYRERDLEIIRRDLKERLAEERRRRSEGSW
jgi:hypothetical protein